MSVNSDQSDPVTTSLESLAPLSRGYLASCISALDSTWDPEVGLVTSQHPGGTVRATSRYALGLLTRDDEDDYDRAVEAIKSLPESQFVKESNVVCCATWARTPEEHHPMEDPNEWRDYDPDWREFVGTTL